MSRRRRQRNPLLVRIIVISVAAHVIALPILAHFGAFDKAKKSFGTATVTMITPQKEVAKPPPPAQKEHKAQAKQTAKGIDKGDKAASRKDLTHVEVANGTGPGNGPVVEQGDRNGGTLPPGVDNGKGDKTTTPTPPTPPDNHEPDKPKPKDDTPTPPPQPTPKPPPPTPKPPPHVPVYTEVEPTFQPQPDIPDDLRADPLDKTAVIEATISPDGTVTNAQLAQGTGIGELDQLALKTAKTWRFKPATADGAPVEGKLRLRIEFKVE